MNDFRIRVATPADAPELLAIYTPYVTGTAVTFEYEVPTVEEFARRISTTLEKYPYIVAEFGGRIIGYSYAGPFRVRAAYAWSVESSIYVHRDMKQRGVGRELYERLEILLAQQNVTNMYAYVTLPSPDDDHVTGASFEFHRRLGYRKVGEYGKCANKFDTWYNMAIMEKQIGSRVKSQPAFIPFPMLHVK